MIEDAFGSKVKVKIIRRLISSEDREFSFEDLSKSVDLSFGSVYPALKDLIDARMVVVRKIGKSKLYKINKKHLLFKEIKMLFKSEISNFLYVAVSFAKSLNKAGIKNIILFGSVARGEPAFKSDIDILIIYKRREKNVKENVEKEVQKFLDLYDVEIVPMRLSVKEALDRRKKFDRFIMNVLNDGKVLYGDIKWLEK